MTVKSSGYETIRSGDTTLFYINRSGLPLTEQIKDRMWDFCKEQYPNNETEIQNIKNAKEYLPIIVPDPPYHIANNVRYTIHEKLQQIQNYVQRLEYNYTGMQFFDIQSKRPVNYLMDIARYIMTESLPIKCFEAFIICLYLTTGITGLDRFNISFKSRFNGTVYRHVILGLKYHQNYGSLGVSRRKDLMYKPLKYDKLSALIDDFILAYKKYGHDVLKVKIGLPIVHDLKSFQTIIWKAIIVSPTKTDKIDYSKEIDKNTRIWRQMNMYETFKSIPSASTVQPMGTTITAAGVAQPNRLSYVKPPLLSATVTTTKNPSRSICRFVNIDEQKNIPCAIRV
ncbi:unnamed protein product [Didymodactylos carnosus]|uniref:Uncharacterized protein n=1 Tax=Didymodactylos carnosus TaxID=1234261 RepID=A0A8S2GMD9_9BILA|nr:unnamed protein product [Didymodactylos carnosus]CAF3536527.1 unnamed protein product [Didymodactylos carnosus]